MQAHQISISATLLSRTDGIELIISFIQGLASPERTIDHRQVVKRSGTPAMCHKLTECQRYDRLSDGLLLSPLGELEGAACSAGVPLRFTTCLCSFMPSAFFADTHILNNHPCASEPSVVL